jgi:hypothetical protein
MGLVSWPSDLANPHPIGRLRRLLGLLRDLSILVPVYNERPTIDIAMARAQLVPRRADLHQTAGAQRVGSMTCRGSTPTFTTRGCT